MIFSFIRIRFNFRFDMAYEGEMKIYTILRYDRVIRRLNRSVEL